MIFIGIDCGTQSLKALAWDESRGIVGSAGRSYDLIEGLPPGHKEQHPSLWINALDECLDELRAKGLAMESVAGIGISGQQHGLVVLDARHDRCGRRSSGATRAPSRNAAGSWMRQADRGLIRKRSEMALPPGFTASKILWLKENEPENYRRVSHILLPHDYLNFYLTGEMVAEAGDASGTGYFQVREREWSTAALSWIDPDRDLLSCIPKLIPSSAPAGQIRGRLRQRWGMTRRSW